MASLEIILERGEKTHDLEEKKIFLDAVSKCRYDIKDDTMSE